MDYTKKPYSISNSIRPTIRATKPLKPHFFNVDAFISAISVLKSFRRITLVFLAADFITGLPLVLITSQSTIVKLSAPSLTLNNGFLSFMRNNFSERTGYPVLGYVFFFFLISSFLFFSFPNWRWGWDPPRTKRRVWDSNPRGYCYPTAFPEPRHRPLGEPSALTGLRFAAKISAPPAGGSKFWTNRENSRYSFLYTSFPGTPFQPLRHLSALSRLGKQALT